MLHISNFSVFVMFESSTNERLGEAPDVAGMRLVRSESMPYCGRSLVGDASFVSGIVIQLQYSTIQTLIAIVDVGTRIGPS
jgi:hypothetical protein